MAIRKKKGKKAGRSMVARKAKARTRRPGSRVAKRGRYSK